MPAGYSRRPDGTYEKRCEFVDRRADKRGLHCVETLVRDRSGKLLCVERTKRALSLAAAKRKKGA